MVKKIKTDPVTRTEHRGLTTQYPALKVIIGE
jgi:hypothetical protein